MSVVVFLNWVCDGVSSQYIFGEFSPDEINQFFVTPRGYVEVRNIFQPDDVHILLCSSAFLFY